MRRPVGFFTPCRRKADTMNDTTQRLCEQLQALLDAGVDRMIWSKPAARQPEWRRAELVRRTLRGQPMWQLARYTQKQVFHQNLSVEETPAAAAQLGGMFLQLNAFSSDTEYTLLLSRKGQLTVRRHPRAARPEPPAARAAGTAAAAETHDRQKAYLLPEGTPIPPLVDMGVFTPDGRVVKARYDKFRQINRFLEIIDDALKGSAPRRLNVIDFGCGKSYLTFLLYHYLRHVRGMEVQMIGLDLKADVIEHCSEAARRYGYDGLRFELGDINGYRAPFSVDMVVCLHACDTATDYALYNALQWNARMIFCVPCCQHELNAQLEPQSLTLLSRYGIVQERFAALATDAIRGRLLEYCGYKTQLLEFIDLAHTPKNLLIRAVRRPQLAAHREFPPRADALTEAQKKALAEVQALLQEFAVQPTLCRLLQLPL